ncbi:hypothetical protein JOC85_001972 [Bacillus mesophilus]|uniref:GerMN domain-containing protein n=1 Tax=Bacillus mesophilus TaxID=1808955 RepID=A0A6M0Q4V5_9BACI|nr:hypothetical protein [Bacillus mesophilus]MBM7661200.1 hypothetical protein [Bacillus mesophilus]NEY71274.1 hypothetical protein [Bacillus mesophilus]
MKKSEWSDKQLEELLEQLPQVKDRQTPDELYRKINARMQDEQVRRKSPKVWVLPSIAAVAAVLLIMVMGPSFLNGTGGTQDSAIEESASESETAALENSSLADDETGIASTEESTELRMATQEINHLVIQDAETYVTLGIPSIGANTIIPVTYMYDDPNTSSLDLVNQLFDQFPYEEFGLSGSLLSEVTFEEMEGNKVLVTVPTDFTVNGSAQSQALYEGIQETLRWMNYSEAILKKEDGSQVELDNYGPIDPIPLSPTMNQGYFLHITETGSTYIVPSSPQSSGLTSIEEAFNAMKTNVDNFELQPSIPADLTIETSELDADSLSVTFPENMINQEDLSHDLMIKAILLTAKEFGYADVTFVNTPEIMAGLQLEVNGEPNPIPVPKALNQIYFPISE